MVGGILLVGEKEQERENERWTCKERKSETDTKR